MVTVVSRSRRSLLVSMLLSLELLNLTLVAPEGFSLRISLLQRWTLFGLLVPVPRDMLILVRLRRTRVALPAF